VSRRTAITTGLCRLGIVALALAVVASGGVAGAENASDPNDAFVVTMESDGDAEVTLRMTFDLTTDSERQAFETLRDNQTELNQLRDSFADRLDRVASSAGTDTDRQMSITNADATVTTASDTGVIELSATWTNLAAVDGEQLRLSEPFASGYSPDRTFVVRPPDGYQLSATPTPDTETDGTLSWEPNTALDGLAITATPDESTGATAGDQPGFGPAVALAGLFAVALFARRRT